MFTSNLKEWYIWKETILFCRSSKRKVFCLSAFCFHPSCDCNFEGQWLTIMSCFFIKSVKIIWIDYERHLSYMPRLTRDYVKVVLCYFKSWSKSQYIGFCVRKINGKDLRSLAHLQFVQIEKRKDFFFKYSK